MAGAPAGESATEGASIALRLAETVAVPRAAREGERKHVTVLFCDIAHSTRLADEIGADRMHGVVNEFFEDALAAIQRFEGTINVVLGDGFMALFGEPVAHEDHARRAALAALAIQDMIAKRSPARSPAARPSPVPSTALSSADRSASAR